MSSNDTLLSLAPISFDNSVLDHYLALAEESLKTVAKQTKSEQMVLAAATREKLLGDASELSKHVATTLGDSARSEIVQDRQTARNHLKRLTRKRSLPLPSTSRHRNR